MVLRTLGFHGFSRVGFFVGLRFRVLEGLYGVGLLWLTVFAVEKLWGLGY